MRHTLRTALLCLVLSSLACKSAPETTGTDDALDHLVKRGDEGSDFRMCTFQVSMHRRPWRDFVECLRKLPACREGEKVNGVDEVYGSGCFCNFDEEMIKDAAKARDKAKKYCVPLCLEEFEQCRTLEEKFLDECVERGKQDYPSGLRDTAECNSLPEKIFERHDEEFDKGCVFEMSRSS